MSSSSSSPPDPAGANSNRSSSDEQGSTGSLPQAGISLLQDYHQPLQPPPPSDTVKTSTNPQRNPPSILSQITTTSSTSATKTTTIPKPQTQTQTQTQAASSAKDQDFFASIRRSIDEGISSTLHSIFGLPSSLKTPSSSNWMVRDEDYDRDRRTKPGSNNDDGDNKGSGWPGSSSSSGPSPPSNSGGEGPSSSNSSRVMGDPRSLWASPISSILLSLGLTSTHLLEQGFRTAHQELSQIAERHERLRQEHQQAMEQYMKENDRENERDMSYNGQELAPASARQCSRQKHFGHDPFGFWAEFFGEDMFGHNRTHPFFSSFFDEFLPEAPFGRHGSPPVGGQTEAARNSWRWTDDAFCSLFDEKLRQAFRESMRQAEQMHDMHLLRQGFPAGQAYEPSEHSYCPRWGMGNPQVTSNAILAAIEQRNDQERQERDHPRSEPSESRSSFLWNSSKCQAGKSEQKDKQVPDTELDLYDYYDKKETTGNTQEGDKMLVFTSKTSVMSQDASGVVTSRIIEESRYSDGSVERVDRTNEEEPNTQQLTSQSSIAPHFQRSIPFSFTREQGTQFHEAFAKERYKLDEQGSEEAIKRPTVNRESKPSSVPSDTQQKSSQDSSSRDGGWRSFFWASDKE